jgi:hypothetical protein
MHTTLRFGFTESSNREGVEADMALAIFAAECVYGRPRVPMEASYLVDDEGRTCVVDVAGESGQAVACVFAGLTAARVGEEAFTVRRLPESTATFSAEARASRGQGREEPRP